jgi:hypothetical protein
MQSPTSAAQMQPRASQRPSAGNACGAPNAQRQLLLSSASRKALRGPRASPPRQRARYSHSSDEPRARLEVPMVVELVSGAFLASARRLYARVNASLIRRSKFASQLKELVRQCDATPELQCCSDVSELLAKRQRRGLGKCTGHRICFTRRADLRRAGTLVPALPPRSGPSATGTKFARPALTAHSNAPASSLECAR